MEEQIHRSNLSSALYLAIKTLEEREKTAGYTGPSGMLAGFHDLKRKVDSSECSSIYIKD